MRNLSDNFISKERALSEIYPYEGLFRIASDSELYDFILKVMCRDQTLFDLNNVSCCIHFSERFYRHRSLWEFIENIIPFGSFDRFIDYNDSFNRENEHMISELIREIKDSLRITSYPVISASLLPVDPNIFASESTIISAAKALELCGVFEHALKKMFKAHSEELGVLLVNNGSFTSDV